MGILKHQYLLVSNDEDLPEEHEPITLTWNSREHRLYRSAITFFALLLLSIALNAILFIRNVQLQHPQYQLSQYQSPYAHLAFDTPIAYNAYTDYWDPKANQSFADEAWDAIDTDPVAIALSDDYAKKHGLMYSTRFPWDTEKSVYYIKGYHDLHCIKLLRRAVVANERGEGQIIGIEHLFHCLDGLRQDIMCMADDTPMPAAKAHYIGDGQVRQCRDWNKMVAWATHPEQNACHKFDDYREVNHSLELFAFCPEDSPYFSVMRSYFELHGHKDPYGPKEE